MCVYNLGDDDDRLFCLLFPKGIFSSSLPAEELSSQLHAHILILSHDDGSHFFFLLSLSLSLPPVHLSTSPVFSLYLYLVLVAAQCVRLDRIVLVVLL